MQGHQAVRDKMNNIKQKQSVHEATAKDEAEFQTLQIVNEMMARKIEFLPVDIYKSEAKMFKVEDGKVCRIIFNGLVNLVPTESERCNHIGCGILYRTK